MSVPLGQLATPQFAPTSTQHVVPMISLRALRPLPSPAHANPSGQCSRRHSSWRRWQQRSRVEVNAALRASEGGGSSGGSETSGRAGLEAAAAVPAEDEAERSRRLIREQQQEQLASHAQPYDLAKTRKLVETAMLAAVTGLAYTLATLLKIEGYMGYFLPLPIIISSLRSGAKAGAKTLATAFLLLFILMGPVKALTYLLVYGVLSITLGTCWAAQLPWAVCIPVASIARVAGYLGYIKVACWVMGEDLMALIVTNIHSLLDQMSSLLGYSGAPSYLAVAVTLGSLLLVNSFVFVGMMHVLYAIVLRSMGLEMSPMPAAVHRFVYRTEPPAAAAAPAAAPQAAG